MKKFIVLYCMPSTGLQDWMKLPAEERQAEESKLKALWDTWASAQGASLLLTAAAGKNTRVTAEGATEASNDLMMYSLVEAEDKEKATAMFVGHPHLQIPGAWIDVMPATKMGI
ncbi:MAG: hypothetical protein WAX38_05095 [Minisyncoccia bacterium]